MTQRSDRLTVAMPPMPGSIAYGGGLAFRPGEPGMGRALARLIAAAVALASAEPATAASPATRVWMRGIVFFPFDDAPATVDRLSGTVVPTRPGRLVDMNDVTSYAVEVGHADVRVPASTMTVLMNRYVLPAAGTSIRHVEVSFGDGAIHLRGTLRKAGVPIGFKATARASATPAGEMRLQVVSMKAAGFVPKSLLDALGLTLAKVARPDNPGIFRIVGDTMFVPVASVFPPPKLLGRLRSVQVTPQALVAVLEGGGASPPPPQRSACYISFRGGRVHFAKLTMTDTDLTMLPKTPAATLGFSPANYYRQLVAGYTLSTPGFGLVSHVTDYRELRRRRG